MLVSFFLKQFSTWPKLNELTNNDIIPKSFDKLIYKVTKNAHAFQIF